MSVTPPAASDLQGRTVLVTGAAGSIGSELVRQIAGFKPARLILVEQAESALYFLHLDVQRLHSEVDVVPIVADVADRARMERIFAEHRPESVFHAAAYKHVPMVEANMAEGILNNVFGTLYSAQAALRAALDSQLAIASSVSGSPILRCRRVPRAPGVCWMTSLARIQASAYSATV